MRATIVTELGAVRCRLLADVSPLAVANFVGLARGLRPFYDVQTQTWETRPYYDGLRFHRAEERLFVQGGRLRADPFVGFHLQDERSIGTAFDKPGILALGNDGQANGSAAQFFITTETARQFDGAYTIIGRCEDLLVVRELEARVLAGEEPRIETVEILRE
nr:peptidylprolyl isomerase [Pseudenhygromyxa sp. WMMC2535]